MSGIERIINPCALYTCIENWLTPWIDDCEHNGGSVLRLHHMGRNIFEWHLYNANGRRIKRFGARFERYYRCKSTNHRWCNCLYLFDEHDKRIRITKDGIKIIPGTNHCGRGDISWEWEFNRIELRDLIYEIDKNRKR